MALTAGAAVVVAAAPASATTAALTWTSLSTAAPLPGSGTPNPPGTDPEVYLSHVSCATDGTCAAIGEYDDASGNNSPPFVLETTTPANAGLWSATEPPLPPGNAGLADTVSGEAITSVACYVATCFAVGSYTDSYGSQEALIDTFSGGAWTAQTAPLPGSPVAPSSGNQDAVLYSVVCPGEMQCVAVGRYSDTNYPGVDVGLVESLTPPTTTPPEGPGTWVASQVASGASSGNELQLVSCPTSETDCVAVGHDASQEDIISVESSGTWTTSLAPLPYSGLSHETWSSVSCDATSTTCVVTGRYLVNSTTEIWAFADTLGSGTWTTSLDEPAAWSNPLLTYYNFTASACPVVGTCVVVGESGPQGGAADQAVTTSFSASSGTWSSLNNPPAPAGYATGALSAVSCSSDGTCTAVGSYIDTSGDWQGLIDSYDGTSWTDYPSPAPQPPDANSASDAQLHSISCLSADQCTAVGYYEDNSSLQEGLIDDTVAPEVTITPGSAIPVTAGTVDYDVTVSPPAGFTTVPTGTVTISDGTSSCTTGSLNGNGEASCGLTEGDPYSSPTVASYPIEATYSGDSNYVASSGWITATAAAGSTAVTDTPDGVIVTAQGGGAGDAVTETQYGSDPTGSLTTSAGSYFDVAVTQPSGYTSVVINDCINVTPYSTTIDWYDGSGWVPLANPTWSTSPACVLYTITTATTPDIAQLDQTIFGTVAEPPAGETTTPRHAGTLADEGSPIGVSTYGGVTWVANQMSNSVTELDDVTGTYANGTFDASTFPVGFGPTGISFDGSHVWVANQGDHDVTELDADGSFANGTLDNSSTPVYSGSPFNNVASDGTDVWVASTESTTVDGCATELPVVTELDASTGTYVNGTLANSSVVLDAGTACSAVSANAVSTNGSQVWVALNNDTVVGLNNADASFVGGSLAAATVPVGTNPYALSVDADNVWVANESDGTVTELDASDGSYVGGSLASATIPVGNSPDAISSNGSVVLVTNQTDDTVSALDASTGAYLFGTLAASTSSLDQGHGCDPFGVAADSGSAWVSCGNDTVEELGWKAPGTPTNVSASVAGGQVTVSWDAATSPGSGPVTGASITATPTDGGPSVIWVPSIGVFHIQGDSIQSPLSGLAGNTSYTFTVAATNASGTGPPSTPSNSVTLAPDPPTHVTAYPANGQISLSFDPPSANGGPAITSYTVTAIDSTNPANGGQTDTISAGKLPPPGTFWPAFWTDTLTNGDAYTFTVTATSADGTSVPSAASASVTPSATAATITSAASTAVLPGKPINIHLTASAASAPTSSSTAWFGTPQTGWLPDWAVLHPRTGIGADTATITGTAPTSPGIYYFDVEASNAPGFMATQLFELDVLGFTSGGTSATFTVGTPGAVTVGTLTGTAGDIVMSAGSSTLPPGVSFTDNGNGTATIAGTPTAGAAKPFVIKITATEDSVKTTESFDLTVDAAPAIAAATTTDSVAAGKSVSIGLTTTGFPAPTVTLGPGAPSWLTATSKKLSGITPTSGGTWTFMVTASNGVGTPTSVSITINALAITSAASVVFTHSMANLFTVTTAGAPEGRPVVIVGTIVGGVAWLHFTDNGNGTATISGTPPEALATPCRIMIKVTAGTVEVNQTFELSVT